MINAVCPVTPKRYLVGQEISPFQSGDAHVTVVANGGQVILTCRRSGNSVVQSTVGIDEGSVPWAVVGERKSFDGHEGAFQSDLSGPDFILYPPGITVPEIESWLGVVIDDLDFRLNARKRSADTSESWNWVMVYNSLFFTLLALPFPVFGGLGRSFGVAPALLSRYEPQNSGTWRCLDGSKEISWLSVNDDYCDCPDGSDEPG